MRVDVVLPDGTVQETSIADGEKTEVAIADQPIVRLTRLSRGHVRLEIHPAPEETKAEKVRLKLVAGGKA